MSRKTIEILLLKEKKDLGTIGSIKKVSLGYARNFLIPQGLGCLITPKIQKILNKKIIIEAENNNKAILKAREIQQNLNMINKFSLKKKVGANNLIFGALTEKEIIELIWRSIGESIDKKNINMPIIRTIGIHHISIKLSKDIYEYILLHIIPENT
uniref:Large ribosomal subunit protein bL9c n=1 Tax=Boldia erythrosiphon TaxID=74908 RepID=A0A1Y9TLP5_9RHOD|nr:50S ribosomal protein L9 [Boldia erythrosiphon]ARO90538.1 50S ribosomal protein L9 [Boldia erythrosiphon]